MIDNPYKDSIAQQIAAKQLEIELLKKTCSSSPVQMLLHKVRIERLELEVETLIHLLNEEETAPTESDVYSLIDKALDERDKEEFIRLTELLRSIQKRRP